MLSLFFWKVSFWIVLIVWLFAVVWTKLSSVSWDICTYIPSQLFSDVILMEGVSYCRWLWEFIDSPSPSIPSFYFMLLFEDGCFQFPDPVRRYASCCQTSLLGLLLLRNHSQNKLPGLQHFITAIEKLQCNITRKFYIF